MTELLEFEGLNLILDSDAEIKVGDTYIGQRNAGPKLLTAKEIFKDKGFIVPVEFPAYCFDIRECKKVIGGID